MVKPFGDPEEYINIRTWESVETHFDKHDFKEFFGGITYISVGEKSIRDVIAFPKTSSGLSLMDESPSNVDEHQLKELHIKIR